MARDLYGEMMGRALQRQAPQGHMPAYITQGEADILRSLGGGVGPAGGQIMRGGIPSFQYSFDEEYERHRNQDFIMPTVGKDPITTEQDLIITTPEQEELGRNYDVPEDVIQDPERAAELAEVAQARERLSRLQNQNLDRTINNMNRDAQDFAFEPVPDPNRRTLVPGGGGGYMMDSPPPIPGPTKLPEYDNLVEDYQGLRDEYGKEGHDLGIVPLANILKNIDRDPNTGKFPKKIDNLWDFMKQGGVAGHLYRGVRDRFSEEGRRKYDLQKDIYRKQRQLYKDAGLDENEIQRIHDQSVRLGLDPLRNAPRNVVGMNRLFGESDRDIAQRAQEEQQADLDMQLANELGNAIIDAPVGGDDPDTELTPEEIAHQERVRKNIEGLSPEYRRRLGLEKAEIGIPEQPPWMPGFYPIGGPEGGIPGGIPEGFTAPMTHINPGDYPDTFINDSTGQIFTAPSLGYVPPAGWRRIDSRPQPDFTRVGGPVGRVPTLW